MTEFGTGELPPEPKCPRCHADMRLKQGSRGLFYGCTRFPDCRGNRAFGWSGLGERVETETSPNGTAGTIAQTLAAGHFVSWGDPEEWWTVVDIDVTEDCVTLEIMDRPGLCREQVVSPNDVQASVPELPRPCFVRIGDAWHSMRLQQEHGKEWNVQTSDDSKVVPGTDIRFQSAAFDGDPAIALGNWVLGNPTEFLRRQEFLTELEEQRVAVAGCTALLSSAIDLYAHQIEVVARVLEDPVPRFILADEVGLGKTIEAGLILRQRMMDGHADKALIIVPDHLVFQWADELEGRIYLSHENYTLVPFSYFVANHHEYVTQDWRTVVVDESHQCPAWRYEGAEKSAAYDKLSALARNATCLLLLSATPQETAPEMMLALLAMLDPAIHGHCDLDAFKRKMLQRDIVVDVLAMMQSGDPVFYYAGLLEQLLEGHDSDSRMGVLIREVCAASDSEREPAKKVLDELRVLLRESFRLHSRLIRSSRGDGELPTWRESDDAVTVTSRIASANVGSRWQELQAAAERWRLGAISHGLDNEPGRTLLSSLYFAVASGEEAFALWRAMRQRRAARREVEKVFGRDCWDSNAEIELAPWEDSVFDGLVDGRTGSDVLESKLEAACRAISSMYEEDPVAHVLLFTASSEACEPIADELRRRFGDQFEVDLLSDAAADEEVFDVSQALLHQGEDEAWGSQPRLVVASARIEEGANLQGAHRVIHLDVPRNMLRLEQRIGRIDRIGQEHGIQQVVVLPAAEEMPCRDHVCRVLEGFDVLFASLSGLQSSAADHFKTLDALLGHRPPDVTEAITAVQNALRTERARLEEERRIDGAQWGEMSLSIDVAALQSRELEISSIKSALDKPIRDTFKLIHDRRGEVGSYRAKRNWDAALSPEDQASLTSFIGDKYRAVKGTFSRKSAAAGSGRLRRVGDPFIDWAGSYLQRVDRGSTYAVLRKTAFWDVDAYGDAQCVWVFSFRVGPQVEKGGDSDLARVRRFLTEREIVVAVPNHAAASAQVAWATEGFATEDYGQCPMEWANLRQNPWRDSCFVVAGEKYLLEDQALSAREKDVFASFMSTHRWTERVQEMREVAENAVRESDLFIGWVEAAQVEFAQVSQEHEYILSLRADGSDALALQEELEARRRIGDRLQRPDVSLRSAGLVILSSSYEFGDT